MMYVAYDYLLFSLLTAGILYFLHGLPLRDVASGWSRASWAVRLLLLAAFPLLLALRNGLDGIQANPYGALRLTELFVLLFGFTFARYRISWKEALYYTFILFLVEVAVEKVAAVWVLPGDRLNLSVYGSILQYPAEALLYLVTPTSITLLVFFVLKRFFLKVQPKRIGVRELVPMALSMVPVLVVGYLGPVPIGENVLGQQSTAMALFLYELCSLTSVLVMIGVDNVAAMRESEEAARTLEALLRLQEGQYESRRAALEEVREKHHDVRHHLMYMAKLESEEDRLAYAAEALETTFGEETFLQTGNEVLDTVLSSAAARCRGLGIRLVLFVEADCMGFVSPRDIVAMAGNALDNAIAAQEGLPEPEREIVVRIHGDTRWLYLRFENGYAGTVAFAGGMPVTTAGRGSGHGYGFKSIVAAAERYDGTVQATAEGGRFTLSILVPQPN